MKFNKGNTVIVKNNATDVMLDFSPKVKQGSIGTVINIVSKSENYLDIEIDWGTEYTWWVNSDALELFDKTNLIPMKVKQMYERQPYMKKKVGIA